MPLWIATISFTLCFAAWGLISAFATTFRQIYQLDSTSTAFLIATPVLLGALARLPVGMLADRFGGRLVFSAIMFVSAGAAFAVPLTHRYTTLLLTAFWLGIAGSSFAVGIGFVSRWTPRERQGAALGVYGLGNIGQSLAVFGGPVLAAAIGWPQVYRAAASLLVIWGIVFWLLARNAPSTARPQGVGEMVRVLVSSRIPALLSLFYFLTFGGFVAFSIYLPTLLRDEFSLSAADAGFRTAGFVILATLVRPLGGWLSDRIGGARVLSVVFLGVVPFALLLGWTSIVPFTAGALGCATLMGIGNGAVFKLVPQYFPTETGTVTGLVGATGGLGGFFPPLLLGAFRDRLGVVWPAFVLLALVALALAEMNRRVFLPAERQREVTFAGTRRGDDRLQAGAWATLATGILVAAIVVGSRNLQNFDPALVIYTFAVVFATWGIVYHYAVWIQKPPTQRFLQRTFELLAEHGTLRSAGTLISTFATHVLAQRFIVRRSALRWWMHQCLFWGCLSAVAITFPLVFGWIHFRSAPGDQLTYVTYLFGFPTSSFRIRTVVSWVLFHGLDFSAVLVLAGIALAMWRRLRDRGALTLQEFSADFLPLVLLFAISVTGLALTASALWLRGSFYGFLAILHAITVIGALLYLPFGKFFHVFQRPAQLGVKLYQEAGDRDEGAVCARCGTRYASKMQIDDLRRVLPDLGFDYRIGGPAATWQGLCPACKRVSLATAQLRLKETWRHHHSRSTS